MKLKKILLLITVLLLLPVKINAYSLGESAVLMEQDTKRVLVSKNMNKKKLIASTTKIMTGIIAVESGKLNKTVTVTDKVLESYGSNIYLSIGEKMKLKDMVYGLMMQSGNDAALMIADYLGGEEKFVKIMNKKAKQIGMKNTREAASAAEAVELLNSFKIDIILLDQQMPGKTGLELARELKNSNNPHLKSLPIIMITVDTKEKTVLDARNLGIQEYLVKPISPLALKKRILNAFGIKQERV